jgi:hypothetical protein
MDRVPHSCTWILNSMWPGVDDQIRSRGVAISGVWAVRCAEGRRERHLARTLFCVCLSKRLTHILPVSIVFILLGTRKRESNLVVERDEVVTFSWYSDPSSTTFGESKTVIWSLRRRQHLIPSEADLLDPSGGLGLRNAVESSITSHSSWRSVSHHETPASDHHIFVLVKRYVARAGAIHRGHAFPCGASRYGDWAGCCSR